MVESITGDELFEPVHDMLTPAEAQRAALKYIEMGWAVTAGPGLDVNGKCTCSLGEKCRNPGKHAYKGWGNDTRITMSAESAEKYWSPDNSIWEKKAAVDQVFIVPYLSGLVVADVDDEDGWMKLDERDRPETLTQVSGSGRGGHRLYRYEWDRTQKLPPQLPGKLLGGCGEVKFRGIIAASPSMHKSGGRYLWDDWEAPIVDAPASMLLRSEREGLTPRSWDEILAGKTDDDRWLYALFMADVGDMDRAGEAKTSRPLVLFAVAASMAVWIMAGRITEEEVVRRVMEAAQKNGALDDYGESDMLRQIKNGINAGITEKRT